jgi:Ca2+-binding RTX toxin-like protein
MTTTSTTATTGRPRRLLAIAGATWALSTLGAAAPAGASAAQTLEPAQVTDCFGLDVPRFTALYVPAGGAPFEGTSGDDVIIGTDDADEIDGNGGNDRICGGRGADEIDGGDGFDRIDGEAGPDDLAGDDDNDWIYGGLNDDHLYGGDDDDDLYGEKGDDTLDCGTGGTDWDWADGGDGVDPLIDCEDG